ncbi:MAG: hypothetical protein ABJ275_12030 [Maricaulaceae bacterium]
MILFLNRPQIINIDPQDDTPIKKFVSGAERVLETCSPIQRRRVVSDLARQINCNPQDLRFMISEPVKEDDVVFPDFQRMLTA